MCQDSRDLAIASAKHLLSTRWNGGGKQRCLRRRQDAPHSSYWSDYSSQELFSGTAPESWSSPCMPSTVHYSRLAGHIYMDLLFHCKVKILIVSMTRKFYVSISLTVVEHFKLWCWKVLQKISIETQYPEHHLCHLQKGTLQVHILVAFLLHQ